MLTPLRQQTERRRIELLKEKEARRIARYLLFAVGRGRMFNLSPTDKRVVKEQFRLAWQRHVLRFNMLGKTPRPYRSFRMLWYGSCKRAWLRWDVPQQNKARFYAITTAELPESS